MRLLSQGLSLQNTILATLDAAQTKLNGADHLMAVTGQPMMKDTVASGGF